MYHGKEVINHPNLDFIHFPIKIILSCSFSMSSGHVWCPEKFKILTLENKYFETIKNKKHESLFLGVPYILTKQP